MNEAVKKLWEESNELFEAENFQEALDKLVGILQITDDVGVNFYERIGRIYVELGNNAEAIKNLKIANKTLDSDIIREMIKKLSK